MPKVQKSKRKDDNIKVTVTITRVEKDLKEVGLVLLEFIEEHRRVMAEKAMKEKDA